MKVQDENARRSSMLVVCRKISSAVWKIFSTLKIYVNIKNGDLGTNIITNAYTLHMHE